MSADDDSAYLLLHGAREKLCLAQMHLPTADDRQEIDLAVERIDSVGTHCCPQWSVHDRTHLDYGEDITMSSADIKVGDRVRDLRWGNGVHPDGLPCIFITTAGQVVVEHPDGLIDGLGPTSAVKVPPRPTAVRDESEWTEPLPAERDGGAT